MKLGKVLKWAAIGYGVGGVGTVLAWSIVPGGVKYAPGKLKGLVSSAAGWKQLGTILLTWPTWLPTLVANAGTDWSTPTDASGSTMSSGGAGPPIDTSTDVLEPNGEPAT